MNVKDKVKSLIAEQLCIPVDKIADDADIMQLGADSIDVVEMLTTFEDEFGISIPDDKIEEMKTLPAIVNLIESRKKK